MAISLLQRVFFRFCCCCFVLSLAFQNKISNEKYACSHMRKTDQHSFLCLYVPFLLCFVCLFGIFFFFCFAWFFYIMGGLSKSACSVFSNLFLFVQLKLMSGRWVTIPPRVHGKSKNKIKYWQESRKNSKTQWNNWLGTFPKRCQTSSMHHRVPNNGRACSAIYYSPLVELVLSLHYSPLVELVLSLYYSSLVELVLSLHYSPLVELVLSLN